MTKKFVYEWGMQNLCEVHHDIEFLGSDDNEEEFYPLAAKHAERGHWVSIDEWHKGICTEPSHYDVLVLTKYYCDDGIGDREEAYLGPNGLDVEMDAGSVVPQRIHKILAREPWAKKFHYGSKHPNPVGS